MERQSSGKWRENLKNDEFIKALRVALVQVPEKSSYGGGGKSRARNFEVEENAEKKRKHIKVVLG